MSYSGNKEAQEKWLTEMQNFTSEVKIMSTIAHPNILSLIGICFEDAFIDDETLVDLKSESSSIINSPKGGGNRSSSQGTFLAKPLTTGSGTLQRHQSYGTGGQRDDEGESSGRESSTRESSRSGLSLMGSVARDVLLVMPFMAQGSLAKILFGSTDGSHGKANSSGNLSSMKLSISEKVRIASEIAYGMHHLHSIRPRIVHRDLKSDNVLMASDGTVKIADFGLSRLVQMYSKTMTTSGTPHYLAPECISGGKFSEKSDVYSYGIILYEIYCEARPFPRKNAFQVMFEVVNNNLRPTIPDHCPISYQTLFQDCTAREPDQRPSFKTIIEKLSIIKQECIN